MSRLTASSRKGENMAKIKMVSLDTSSTVTGYAYFENGVLKDYGELNHEKEKDAEIRLEDMCLDIAGLLSDKKPLIVAIELTSVTRNAHTQRILSEIVGVVRGWVLCNFAEFVRYRASEWRKLVCCKGEVAPTKRNEAKEWAIIKVAEEFDIKGISDNVAEAILIGQARINQMQAIAKKQTERTA